MEKMTMRLVVEEGIRRRKIKRDCGIFLMLSMRFEMKGEDTRERIQCTIG